MDSVIEVQRQTHEEVERLWRAMATVLSRYQTTQQTRLANEYKASDILDRICSRVITLNSLYQDRSARQAEIESISSQNMPDDLGNFLGRLDKIKEYHFKYPNSTVDGFEMELAILVGDEDERIVLDDQYEEEDLIYNLFSGEESFGRYLDLYTHHTAYNNLKSLRKRVAYLQYLDVLLVAQNGLIHNDLSKETRYSKDYESYITALHLYLFSFTKRTNPLKDINVQQAAAIRDFEILWDEGKLQGWDEGKRANNVGDNSNIGVNIWCSACQKFYTKQTVYDAHLKSKRHVKASFRLATDEQFSFKPNSIKANSAVMPKLSESTDSRIRSIALFTYLTTSLLTPLVPTINETKSNVERRFSLTAREREAELLEKPAASVALVNPDENAAKEEEEEEERIYNPLKLPLGWDGKPIPYWLYKLHGLGVEYRCEICSDHVYMGRKNFDRHFQESRHAFGMRALGLPNTKHFHEITRIEDALSLAEKLKQEGKQEIFQQETMEELEDDEGNVYNRKTYEDLKKQGLI